MGTICSDISRLEDLDSPVLDQESNALKLFGRRQVSTVEYTIEEVQKWADKIEELDHPNLVKVRECQLNSENNLLVFEEQYSKENLECLSHQQRLSLNPKRIMRELAAGLQHLNSKGIIHERMCPANIYFKGKVTMIAGVLDNWNNPDGILPSQIAYYVAPESSSGMYGESSDIWSLGLIFLQLQIGKSLRAQLMSSLQPWKLADFPPNYLINTIDESKIRKMLRGMLSRRPQNRPSIKQVVAVFETQKKTPSRLLSIERLYKLYENFRHSKSGGIVLMKWYQIALRHIHEQASRGNPKAMFLYGLWLNQYPYKQQAKLWTFRAMEQGIPYANVLLIEWELDNQKKKAQLEKWVQSRHPLSLNLLALYYALGKYGFPLDRPRALQILLRIEKFMPHVRSRILSLQASTQGFPTFYPREFLDRYKQAAIYYDRKSIESVAYCLMNVAEYYKAIPILIMVNRLGVQRGQKFSDTRVHIGLNYRRIGDIISMYRWMKTALAGKDDEYKQRAVENLGF